MTDTTLRTIVARYGYLPETGIPLCNGRHETAGTGHTIPAVCSSEARCTHKIGRSRRHDGETVHTLCNASGEKRKRTYDIKNI